MFKLERKTKLPNVKKTVFVDEEVVNRDWENKIKGKIYADDRRGAQPNQLKIRDKALVKAQKIDRLTTNFTPMQQTDVNSEQSEVTIENGEVVWMKRHLTAVRNF